MNQTKSLFLAAIICLIGCNSPGSEKNVAEDYDKSLADGLTSLKDASQFEKLFPKSEHFISYYTGDGTHIWNSKAGLYGRYVLSMQVEIKIDRNTHKVSANGEPKFYLNEVTSVKQLPDGRASISYDGAQVTFGREKWQLLIQRNGDLSVLGFTPKTDAPVSGFEAVWKKS
jgi:hypothetical protein